MAERAGRVIEQQFALLELNAAIGRPSSDSLDLRELVIPFGNAGYVALYRHDSADDVIYVPAFRHQREAGYWSPRIRSPNPRDHRTDR